MIAARSKHELISTTLEHEIREGKFSPGQKLPSEAAIVKRFNVSRITAGRAVRDLQRLGLVERRAGSGTYVRDQANPRADGLVFGLLIPNLGETEIFEPICRGMAASPLAAGHALLWGNATSARANIEDQALHLCRQYIQRHVDGVFFAPVELRPESYAINRRILADLDAAGIPVVLLDRCVEPYPDRSDHDLVGIDNRRAGFIITRHLLRLGSRSIAFAAYKYSASTVEARIGGYLEALFLKGGEVQPELVYRFEPGQESEIVQSVRHHPEAIVCANDYTAGQVMHALLRRGYRIPEDIRIVGIDDMGYASLLPVPLTTVHQPVDRIGAAAMAAMVERIAHPDTPVRDILLGCEVVVRRSCGAAS